MHTYAPCRSAHSLNYYLYLYCSNALKFPPCLALCPSHYIMYRKGEEIHDPALIFTWQDSLGRSPYKTLDTLGSALPTLLQARRWRGLTTEGFKVARILWRADSYQIHDWGSCAQMVHFCLCRWSIQAWCRNHMSENVRSFLKVRNVTISGLQKISIRQLLTGL